MRAEGSVGPRIVADGEFSELRLGKSGELVLTGLHGKYYEQNYRGRLFWAGNAASGNQVLNTVGGVGWGGPGIYNPPGSGTIISLVRTYLLLSTLPTTNQVAGAFVYVYATNVTLSATAPLTTPAQSCIVGSSSVPVAQLYRSGNVSTAPTTLFPIASKTGAVNPASSNALFIDEVEGSIILTPGSFLTVMETTSDTGANFNAWTVFIWEELPI